MRWHAATCYTFNNLSLISLSKVFWQGIYKIVVLIIWIFYDVADGAETYQLRRYDMKPSGANHTIYMQIYEVYEDEKKIEYQHIFCLCYTFNINICPMH